MSKRSRLVSLLALAIASPALAQTTPDPNTPPAPPPAGDQPTTPPATGSEPQPTTPPVAPTPPMGEQPAEPPKVEPKKEEVPKPSVHSKWDATLYGFAELDAIWDSTLGFGELAGGSAIARPNTYAGDHGQTTFTPRNSRIGFKLAAPETTDKLKATAQLEMDFLGNQPPGISESSLYGNGTFRIRHMNVKLETPYVDILAGQYWNLFGWQSLFQPNTVAIQGVPGEVYSRVAQVRVGKVIKGGSVDVELQIAANRPAERASQSPDGVAAIKVIVPEVKAWHTAGSTGSSLDAAALGVSVIGRRFTPPNFSATPNKQESKNGYGIAVDALIPVIPATKKSHAGALTLTGEFVYGAGLADQYAGFTGGVGNAALPNPTGANPAPTYTSVLDGGLALFSADGTLHPIQWTSLIGGAQFYLNDEWWISANYSHMSSGNAHLFGAATKVFDTSNWADGNLMVDITPAYRVGAEFSWFNQTYVDMKDATDYRVQGSFFFIF